MVEIEPKTDRCEQEFMSVCFLFMFFILHIYLTY